MRSLIPLALLAFPATAMAQDRCSDVLKEGTFSYASMSRNDYFNQIIYSRFYQSTFEQARNDTGMGFGVPVGDIVLGGNFNNSSHRNYGRTSERTYFNSLTSAQHMDLALMTGDKEIIGAWRDCMQNRAGGGLAARFLPDSDTNITLIVEFFPYGDRVKDKLAESIALPAGVEVLQNGSCLKKGYTYKVGNSNACHIPLRVSDRSIEWKVAFRGQVTSTTAWLPKRPVLVQYDMFYPFTADDSLPQTRGNCCRNILISKFVELTPQQISDGWSFDAASRVLKLDSRSHGGSSDNRCHSEFMDVDLHRISYGYRLYAPDRDRNDGKVTCRVSLSIKIRRNFWSYDIADDEPTVVNAGPAANVVEKEALDAGLVPAFK